MPGTPQCLGCGRRFSIMDRKGKRFCDERCRSRWRRDQPADGPVELHVVADDPAPLRKPPRRRNLPTGDSNPEKKRLVLQMLARGYSLAQCSRKAMLSPDTIRVIADEALEEGSLQPPVPPDPKAAARAMEDFDFFRTRYFGRVVMPWQSDAGRRLLELKDDAAKEYVVLNVFPGSGKSTLFAHDLVCFLAVRDRSLRILIGSRTLRQAQTYTNRLRRTFARLDLAPVDDEDLDKGLAVPPTGILTEDFGRFTPIGREEMWTADQFVLFQWGRAITEKEASFAAYGMDSGFLGGRFDVIVWDDLVDNKSMRTIDAREHAIRLYEDEIESRMDPGGLLVLQGQRMRTDDLYRHVLDMKVDADLDAGEEGRPKYRHIVYRAHHEDRCRGIETHGKDTAVPWTPDGGGCLLDPIRLPWREVATIRANREEKWAVLYQQEDVDPDKVLVQRVWVDGGINPITGERHPGCWDDNRGLAEVPKGLTAPYLSVATCDPSPSRFWAIQWWIVERSTERRYLLDLIRQPLEAPEFIDWDHAGNRFTGIMEDWQRRSIALGAPISHWIVEINAARFLYQHDYVKRWQALHQVALIPHTTHLNRNDSEFGVQTIGPHYRFGRVRLPGKQKVDGGSAPGRQTAMKLVDEVTRWPDSPTDDTVLAHWFLEFQLPRITPPEVRPPKAKRPSWL